MAVLSEPILASVRIWRPVDYIPQFTCKCGCKTCKMDKDFLQRFQRLRIEWFNKTRKDLVNSVSSGYRCKNHPIEKRKIYGLGPHTKGKAVDIKVSGSEASIFFRMAKKHMTGIGLAQRGRKKRSKFIHLDSLTPKEARRPAVWIYKR